MRRTWPRAWALARAHAETELGISPLNPGNLKRLRVVGDETDWFSRLGAEGSRSNSPQVGVLDDPPPPPVKKGRPPKNSTPKNSKKKGAHSATPEVANGTKRPASPLPTPPKNAKKMKAGTASPSLSSKGLPPSVPSAQSLQKPSSLVKVPSRLRATSTSSHAMAISPSASVIANAMDVDYDAGAVSQSSSHSRSPTQRSQSGTPDSFMRNGVSSGMSAKTVPGKTLPTGYLPPRPAMPMSVTAHNDPDYLAVDADDMVDTDTDDNDDGEDD
ncbi:hypothetical protein FRB99_000160 [Tulasnella sp. 403]|nr:hypothetical protein FRB99_000160 [Tulasnella sp. 403]